MLNSNWNLIRSSQSPEKPINSIAVFVDAIHQIRQAAPHDIETDWAELDEPFQDLVAVLDKTGTSWEEIGNNTLDRADVAPITEALNRLARTMDGMSVAFAVDDAKWAMQSRPEAAESRRFARILSGGFPDWIG